MIAADDLKSIPLFACLTDAQRERVAQNAAELRVSAGEWLIREGELPWFFVLLEGCLEVEKDYGGSPRVTKLRYEPGDFFGETPILLDSTNIASLRAHLPSRVIRLDRMLFKEFMDASTEWSNMVVHVMMKRVALIRDYVRENNPMRVQVIGTAFDTECRNIRTFLALNRIPYEWIDREKDPDRVPYCTLENRDHPFAVIDKTFCIGHPITARKVADALGMQTRPTMPEYDVVIIGGGPAGLAAAVYGASEGLSVLLVERNAAGGQAGTSSRIENYLGFPDGLSGDELAMRALKQARRFGAEVVMTQAVTGVERLQHGYCVRLTEQEFVRAKSIIIATGVDWRRHDAGRIEDFQGRGVLYGAAKTEASAVVGKQVFIVGGGNSAGQAAMFFSGYAAKVTILVRGPGLNATMSQYLIDQLSQRHNIAIEAHTKVVSVSGDDALRSIVTQQGSESRARPADALFLMIGARAKTDWLPKDLERDTNGFICTGRDVTGWELSRSPYLLETSLPGVFCAGDVRHDSIKRVSSGVGEGSMAIAFIHQYLSLAKAVKDTRDPALTED